MHSGRAAGATGESHATRSASPADTARTLAALEGAEAAVVLANGASATRCTLLALLRTGDHLVAGAWLSGETRHFLEHELASLGIEVTVIDPTVTRAWRRAVRRNTRVLFLESPVNPTTRVVDLRPARMLSLEHGVALVVDSTLATPFNLRPIEHGADVVIHSTSQFLSGMPDLVAGVVCGTESVVEEVRAKMVAGGHTPEPSVLVLLDRGLRTLAVRMDRQNRSASQLAQWAAQHPAVRAVHYPALATHPDHALASEMLDGCGGVLAIELRGGAPAADRLLSRVSLFSCSSALGDTASGIMDPRRTMHSGVTPTDLVAIGLPLGFLRLSVGLEDVDDLVADLSQALES